MNGPARTASIHFLDVLLGDADLDGIVVSRRVRQHDAEAGIVFAMVSLVRAPEGYGLDASGYLLKPFYRERLEEALDRALERARRIGGRDMVLIEAPARMLSFDARDVSFLEVRNHTVTVSFLGGGEERVNLPLSQVLARFPEGRFVQCHRAFAVNVDAVRAVDRRAAALSDGTEVPVGAKFYGSLQKALLDRARRRFGGRPRTSRQCCAGQAGGREARR